MNPKSKNAPRKGIAVNDIVFFFETAEHNNKKVNVRIVTAGTCSNIGRFISYPILGKITIT